MPDPAGEARSRSPLSPWRATGRLTIATVVAVATVVFLTPSELRWWVRAIAGWDAASLVLIGLAWTIIVSADADRTKARAGEDDPGRHMVFVIALVAGMVSLVASSAVLAEVKGYSGTQQIVWMAITIAAVVLSWCVTHTGYTLRYAHLYYEPLIDSDGDETGCVSFPGTEAPSDIDFAYLAFTIGMCFQVSDMQLMTTEMRREVLVHALISFVYNTAILALALNIVLHLLE